MNIIELKRLYEEERMTYVELGNKFNCNHVTIFKLLKNNGVKSRSVARRNQIGKNNTSWKGDNPSCLDTFHMRLNNSKGRPKLCENCNTNAHGKTYDWANMTGNYDDPNDYKRLCRSCHKKYDYKRKKNGSIWNNRFVLLRNS